MDAVAMEVGGRPYVERRLLPAVGFAEEEAEPFEDGLYQSQAGHVCDTANSLCRLTRLQDRQKVLINCISAINDCVLLMLMMSKEGRQQRRRRR